MLKCSSQTISPLYNTTKAPVQFKPPIIQTGVRKPCWCSTTLEVIVYFVMLKVMRAVYYSLLSLHLSCCVFFYPRVVFLSISDAHLYCFIQPETSRCLWRAERGGLYWLGEWTIYRQQNQRVSAAIWKPWTDPSVLQGHWVPWQMHTYKHTHSRCHNISKCASLHNSDGVEMICSRYVVEVQTFSFISMVLTKIWHYYYYYYYYSHL